MGERKVSSELINGSMDLVHSITSAGRGAGMLISDIRNKSGDGITTGGTGCATSATVATDATTITAGTTKLTFLYASLPPPQQFLAPTTPGHVVPMSVIRPTLSVELWPHNFIILSAMISVGLAILNLFTLPLTVPAIVVGVLVSFSSFRSCKLV
jgi:hypothetical protein